MQNKLCAKYEYAEQNCCRKTGYKRKRTKWVLVDMYKNVIYVYSALDGQGMPVISAVTR